MIYMLQKNEISPKSEGAVDWVLMIALLAGPFLTMLDSSVVNVALPDIATTFNSSLTEVQWVLSGYLLSLAAVLVACAFLSKRFGASRVYIVSLVGFILASAACAFAPSLEILIIGRALQGAFGAPLVPLAMDLLLGGHKSGARKIPVGFGIVLFLAPAIGPTVGGLLINTVGWPYVFLINLPIGIAAAALLLVSKTMSKHDVIEKNISFDLIGSVMLAAGLVLTLYGASEGAIDGWLSMSTFPFLVLGVVLILSYVAWAMKKDKPAIDLKILRSFDTALPLIVSVIASIIMFSVLFLVPVMMEDIQGFSAMDTGLALLPQGIVMGLGSVIGDRIYMKKLLSIRATVMTGMLLLVISTAALLLMSASTPGWVTAIILSGRGFAIGLTIQPLLFEMIATLKQTEVSDGNTLFNVMQRLGGSIGISALATVFQSQETSHIKQVLISSGISSGAIGQGLNASALSGVPAVLRDKILSGAMSGFHDTVYILLGLAILGLILSAFLKERQINT